MLLQFFWNKCKPLCTTFDTYNKIIDNEKHGKSQLCGVWSYNIAANQRKRHKRNKIISCRRFKYVEDFARNLYLPKIITKCKIYDINAQTANVENNPNNLLTSEAKFTRLSTRL